MYEEEKSMLIYWAKKLNEKGFVTARSGNISLKVDKGILITSHDCYLGELKNSDILLIDNKGKILEGTNTVTSEGKLHLSIHEKFPEAKVIIHAHSPYTTALFYYFDKLDVFSFEAKFYLGNIKAIPQDTPTVTDVEPVLKELENSNIVVLSQHGVVSVGADFKEAFSLIELLEEQAKVNLFIKRIAISGEGMDKKEEADFKKVNKYELLSKGHIERLVELVNSDREAQELGKKYGLTCTLAVKDTDNGTCVCFHYKDGKIIKTDTDENAEFVIAGKYSMLKKIFNRQIDPFVASTQGKVKTKGDFTKMSKWYPVLVRTFKLWEQAPVK